MKVLVFLVALVFVVICGAWLFTSEHSPLVSALGIGAEGDFEGEAKVQIPSLVDLRESAYCMQTKRRSRHEWEGRYQHVSVKLLPGNPDFDAEGTVRYYVIDPRGGSSQDCEDVFRRSRSNSKWELVSDPSGDERQRLASGNQTVQQQPAPHNADDNSNAAGAGGTDAEQSFWNENTGYWMIRHGDADGEMGFLFYASRDGIECLIAWTRIGQGTASKGDFPSNGWPGAKITITSTDAATVDFGLPTNSTAHTLAELTFHGATISGMVKSIDESDGSELAKLAVEGTSEGSVASSLKSPNDERAAADDSLRSEFAQVGEAEASSSAEDADRGIAEFADEASNQPKGTTPISRDTDGQVIRTDVWQLSGDETYDAQGIVTIKLTHTVHVIPPTSDISMTILEMARQRSDEKWVVLPKGQHLGVPPLYIPARN